MALKMELRKGVWAEVEGLRTILREEHLGYYFILHFVRFSLWILLIFFNVIRFEFVLTR